MDNAMIELFLRTFAVLSVLLLIGTILRAKVKVLQNIYIPACVIGGTLGLVLGPKVLNLIPFSEDIIITSANIPGKLFGIIIAGLPMCAAKIKKEDLKTKLDIWILALMITMVGAIQVAIGLGVNLVCSFIGKPTYPGFGTEMFMGYCGGHGLGTVVGSYFQGLGQDYWETAQGVAMSCATIGMVGGVIAGTFVINYGIRKRKTHYVTSVSEIAEDMRTGLYKDVSKQQSIGRETTNPGSIDTLTLHFALLMLAVGTGYIAYDFIHKYSIPFLKDMDSWVFMLVAMYIYWPIVRKLGWDKYFDENIKSKIQGALTDFIVTAAIFSMPLEMVIANLIPLVASCATGLIVTVLLLWIIAQKFVLEDPVEKAMGPIGMMTGDFITGVLLLKMIDPELKSNALSDFSIAYTINTFYCLAMLAFVYPCIVKNGAGYTFIIMVIQAAVITLATVGFGVFAKRKNGHKYN